MSASIDKYSVAKLNNENYFNWRFRMEMVLKEKDIWSVISEDAPTPVTDIWKKADEKAFATIVLTLEDDQLQHVRSCKSANDAWKSLKDFHEKDSPGNRVRILRTIMNQRIDESGDVEQHVTKLNELFQKLLAHSCDIKPEFLMSATLLGSLPSSYDSLITALEARKEEELTSSFVRAKIVEEYRRRRQRDGKSGDSVALRVSENKMVPNSKSITCLFCKKKGHVRKDCYKFTKWLQNKKGKNNANLIEQNRVSNPEFLFVIGKWDGWILDSGATCHISCQKGNFISFDATHREKVSVANGNEVISSGRGTVIIDFVNNNGDSTKVKLCDVLFVPDIGGNLVSVKQITQKGFKVDFIKDICEIRTAQNRQIAVGDVKDNLYKMRIKESVNFIQNKSNKCIHDWHRILGHRDIEVVKNLSSSELINGYKVVKCNTKCELKTNCEICIKGKMTRISFPKESFNKTSAVLDLVHSDLCGPMQTKTPGGKKYILTFIDDFSRYTMIYLLTEKSQAFEKFKHYYELTRNLFNKSIKMIRTDRGGEYMGEEFKKFLKSHGIQSQRTAPHTPQQNGVAERKNRTLIEMTRCLLFDANMENKYWGEAIVTANFLQNLLPWKQLNHTPFELWHDRKPIYANLHRFGSKCFVKIQDGQRKKKLDAKAVSAILLGFDLQSKAYRCFIPEQHKVVISRDVKFLDDVQIPEANIKETAQAQCDKELAVEIEILSDEIRDIIPINSDEEELNQPANSINEPVIHNTSELNENNGDAVPHRQSTRTSKGIPPKRLIKEINLCEHYSYIAQNGEPTSYNQAITDHNKEYWLKAMDFEIKSLQDNNTWDLVELPAERKAIGCKWVYKIKSDSNNKIKYKARLVAQGYNQKFGIDYDEVFAPVARHPTLKILLSVAAQKNMSVQHFDAKSAFLNGALKEEIYMKQPPGYIIEGKENHVCLLNKSLYGLKQSARVWNQTLHTVFIALGLKQSRFDACLYTYKNKRDIIYLIVYVDDILMASTSPKIASHIETELQKRFSIYNLGEINHYLGMRIIKNDQKYLLDQERYINNIVSEFGLNEAKAVNTPMDTAFFKNDPGELLSNNENYRKAIGSLLYVAINTRPDISAAVSILAQRVEKPTQRDWVEVKRVIKYLKTTATVKLQLGLSNQNEKLIGFSDADWGEDRQTRKSNTGFVFIFGGPISWTCRKQTCVAQSSTEAEFIALSEASKECIWLRNILNDFYLQIKEPTIIYEDNQSCIHLVHEEKFNMRTKHIDIKAHHIKDNIENGTLAIEYCSSETNIADLLTKPLSNSKFNNLKSKFGLIEDSMD